MRANTIIAAVIGIYSSLTIAAPLATPVNLQITDVVYHRVEGANVTISFKVYNPSPLSNVTATCSGEWAYGSGAWPSGSYDACSNSTIGWNMQTWTSWQTFVLGIESTYEDPSVGSPPYDEVQVFARANITAPGVTCSAMGGYQSCEQPAGGVITGEIYAEAA